MPGRAGSEPGGCTLPLLGAPLRGPGPSLQAGRAPCISEQGWIPHRIPKHWAAPPRGLSTVRAGWLVPCGCCRCQAALPIPPRAGPPVLLLWREQPVGCGELSSEHGGAVQGGPSHLAGPCKREFLSFILLINTVYFIFLAGL